MKTLKKTFLTTIKRKTVPKAVHKVPDRDVPAKEVKPPVVKPISQPRPAPVNVPATPSVPAFNPNMGTNGTSQRAC